MRIQNNITAMNTHRQYTINNDNVAKNAEKLSSGYRINRAGDDAAGLAISEKMRSQIRGLNMATKNSQDAISLVQTAEGALQETHAMLQRMNELAVQAATGTNEDLDRTALAKEFEQLKREINDVAEQTNFNNMKILDGSLSYEGFIRSAATAGVNQTVQTNTTVVDPGATVNVVQDAVGTATGTQAKATFNCAITSSDAQEFKLTVKVGGKEMQLVDASGNEVAGVNTGAAAAKAGDLFTGLFFTTDDNRTFQITGTASSNKLVLTEVNAPGTSPTAVKSDLDWEKFDISLNISSHDKGTAEGDKWEKTSVDATLDTTAASDVVNGVTEKTAQTVKTEINLDPEKIKNGDTLEIGGKVYKFYAKTGEIDDAAVTDGTAGTAAKRWTGTDADGNTIKAGAAGGNVVNVVWNGETGASSNLAQALETAMKGTANTAYASTTALDNGGTASATAMGVSVSRTGNRITLEGTPKTFTAAAAGAAGAIDKKNQTDAETAASKASEAQELLTGKFTTDSTTQSTKTTVEFDIAKMKDGDKFTLKIGGKNLGPIEFKATDDRKSFMAKVNAAAEKAGFKDAVKGNALIIEDKLVDDIKLEWDNKKDTNAIRIQVGALENEQLAVSIDSMNTAGLGLDDAALTKIGNSVSDDQDLCGKAITAVRNAINKVSDQRATLGAMQNRLDHKIANLKVASENLSASESRIRDVDMASEMTQFTKNNILSQAATAMLAQANSLPQNVLSLLG